MRHSLVKVWASTRRSVTVPCVGVNVGAGGGVTALLVREGVGVDDAQLYPMSV